MRVQMIPAALLLLLAPISRAQPIPVGGEFQINSHTTEHQNRLDVAADAEGNFVVVWQSWLQDGDAYGIHSQRFDAAGQPLGGEFQVNSFTPSFQTYPAVAADSAGNFVAVWQSSGGQDGDASSIQAQRFDADGSPLGGEFQVNSYTTSRQAQPAIAMNAGGQFIVVWDSGTMAVPGPDGDGIGVQGQRFDALGNAQGTEFEINVFTTGLQRSAAVAIGEPGDFVVTWMSNSQDGDGYSVHGRRFDANGDPLDDEFQLNAYTTGLQASPEVAIDPQGRFVIVWSSEGIDGDEVAVQGQRFDAAGQPQGEAFQVNSYTTASQGVPSVATDAQGNFLVVWHTGFGQDGDGRSAHGQSFDAAGTRRGGEFQINTYTTNSQGFPHAVIGTDGVFVVWQSLGQDGDNYGVVGQRYLNDVLFADGFESGDTSRW